MIAGGVARRMGGIPFDKIRGPRVLCEMFVFLNEMFVVDGTWNMSIALAVLAAGQVNGMLKSELKKTLN